MVVWKNGTGIAFWMDGVPGSATIVKVKLPRPMVAGMRRFGTAAARKSDAAMGYTENATTNRETPPYCREHSTCPGHKHS